MRWQEKGREFTHKQMQNAFKVLGSENTFLFILNNFQIYMP